MKKLKNQSSLLSKYTLMYEKKPRSRVFAPLAESYRKLGMHKEAFKLLNEGIKIHPTYTLGYVVLAHCYYDLQNYEMAYNTLRPFVSQNLENIRMQKIFGNTCMRLGYLEEALQTFKYLLLLNPKDMQVAEQIKKLEDDLLVDVQTEIESEQEEATETDSNFSTDEDDWVQVDFHSTHKNLETDIEGIDDWTVTQKSPLENFKEEVKTNKIEVSEHKLDDQYFHEDYDNVSDEPIVPEKLTEQEGPIITHTLVDLYCKQGHYAQAAAILESILDLHPEDEYTRKKLDEVTMLLVNETVFDKKQQDNEVGESEQVLAMLQGAYEKFHKKLSEVSKEKLS